MPLTLLPLTTEVVWRGLTGGRSVHLTDWPMVDELPSDAALVEVMDRVREVCSTALGLRMASKLRVRLPLSHLRVAAADAKSLERFIEIIRDEVNVKHVELTDDVTAHGQAEIVVNARVAGPRLGKQVQEVIRAAKAGHWTTTPEGRVHVAGVDLLDGEYERRLVSRDVGATAELPRASGFVVLDTTVTPELAAEGLARDVIRAVQQARRDAGLSVSDRIRLIIGARDDVVAAARAHEKLLASETLALEVRYGNADGGFTCKVGDGAEVAVRVERIS
jgi:isoleucyl-tRNA synthetase